jgi:hypothetical protein
MKFHIKGISDTLGFQYNVLLFGKLIMWGTDTRNQKVRFQMSKKPKDEVPQKEAHLREGLDMLISDYLNSYSVLEFLTEVIPICEAKLHYKAGIQDTTDSHYDLGIRIKQMDATLLGFLKEFDLDLVVSSLIVCFRNHAETIENNEDYALLYLNLASLLDKQY